jgi:hypothetical protein
VLNISGVGPSQGRQRTGHLQAFDERMDAGIGGRWSSPVAIGAHRTHPTGDLVTWFLPAVPRVLFLALLAVAVVGLSPVTQAPAGPTAGSLGVLVVVGNVGVGLVASGGAVTKLPSVPVWSTGVLSSTTADHASATRIATQAAVIHAQRCPLSPRSIWTVPIPGGSAVVSSRSLTATNGAIGSGGVIESSPRAVAACCAVGRWAGSRLVIAVSS